MSRHRFVCLLVFNMVAAIAAELPAQGPTPESTARRRFNQVFVKVIVPVTSRTPKQDGSVVESWVAEQLKQLGESEYFAVTDWVPVCDGLFADDIVDNDVWDGRLDGKHRYCPVGGDIPERENGRLSVSVAGWLPFGGCEANITLLDEPGNRAVGPVQILVGIERKPAKVDERLPYVAVIIAPPPQAVVTSHRDAE
ncbi:hypothetical protein [Novipirellula artificiosorum]|uniref:Uncharacterized protein n=1 Tax=Novipirellula artificiosorum TaxID=2528016 RepID=A0A5C6CW58_9BACT|nr:hypothetical protein [Novipirellula artificiosorum]TWU27944.1 hypothetical protein Poly41_70180 [Novipirellula artificiosorum]